ncbi:MAG TPA: MinD/ParA family protein [Anaerolineae bacterium]|jgi:flagellar biosynthesis protein FlhG|nr:MinD/ParA family protein [Anaerolineae bacterium]
MDDQAKKLRELAQRIREERGRESLIIDPIKKPEKILLDGSITPETKNQDSLIHRTNNTRIIAISSGKGGVGKSNLVVNLGIALAMRSKKVAILDADLGLANIDVLLGINPKYNLQHLVDGKKTVHEILLDGPHAIKVVPGGSGIPELANLSDDKQQKIIEDFVELDSEADIALIDTGAGISKNVIAFILAAREAIIITTPEPTAITDAYGLIKVITQRDIDVDMKIVVNMVSSEKEGQEIAGRIVIATRQFLNKRIEVLGYITSDGSVNASVRRQKPFILEYPGARASRCIKQIAASLDITNGDDMHLANRNGFRGFLSRLFER